MATAKCRTEGCLTTLTWQTQQHQYHRMAKELGAEQAKSESPRCQKCVTHLLNVRIVRAFLRDLPEGVDPTWQRWKAWFEENWHRFNRLRPGTRATFASALGCIRGQDNSRPGDARGGEVRQGLETERSE